MTLHVFTVDTNIYDIDITGDGGEDVKGAVYPYGSKHRSPGWTEG